MKRASPGESPSVTLRRAAMDHLARREHSFHELLVKLGDKFPDFDRDSLILPVLERLREENLQNDARFVESYVRHRRNRGHGPLKIRAELQQKGVPSSLITVHLYDEATDWRQLAREALEKKHPVLKPDKPQEQQRYYRFLAQRGFDSEDIGAVLKELRKAGKTENGREG